MAEVEKPGVCEVCRQPAIHKCPGCKQLYYCSPEHQKENWQEHKDKCKSYEVCQSPELGTFLKTNRDLTHGDVIFSEVPLVVGPKAQNIEEGAIPCVGCCRLIEAKYCERCPDCLWPACSMMCKGLKDVSRHGAECRVLKLKLPEVMTYTPETVHKQFRFDILIALRALFLQKISKVRWQKFLCLEARQEKRGQGTTAYQTVNEKVTYLNENFLIPLKKYEEESKTTILADTSTELLHRIYGIIDVNSWEYNENNVDMSIVYPTAGLLEQNCVPNVAHSIGKEKENYRITIRAAVPIKEGQHLTTTYTNILWGTRARRHHLKTTKYISCTCERCKDPTELGTFFSALKCLGADGSSCDGIQLPVNPLEKDVQWVCEKCRITLPSNEIMKFVDRLGMEVEKVMMGKPSAEELGELVEKLGKFLHPNHYHMYTVKHNLVQLYNSRFAEGVELSDNFLKQKVEMCNGLIGITKTFDPGHVKLGIYLVILLHELFEAKLMLLDRNYSEEKRDSFVKEIKDISNIVDECKEILQSESNSNAAVSMLQVIRIDEIKLERWKEDNSFVY